MNLIEIKEIEKQIRKFFEKREDIICVYLFGSFVNSTDTSESDIDIAILVKEKSIYDGFKIISLREELSGLLKRDVDLVLLNNASPIIRMQVLKHGKKLVDSEVSETISFTVKTLFEYDDLKRVRKPIESKLLKNRIYG